MPTKSSKEMAARIDNKGYAIEYNPSHPVAQRNGFVLQHRRIWFDKVGNIPTGYEIHHKNGNRSDNRIVNLECISHSEHMRKHYPHGFRKSQGKPTVYITLKCFICKIKFKRTKTRSESDLRRRVSQRSYCSLSCAARQRVTNAK